MSSGSLKFRGKVRGEDPSRILFDYDEDGNPLPLKTSIFLKKFDVQVTKDEGLGDLTDWIKLGQEDFVKTDCPDLMKDAEVYAQQWDPRYKIRHLTSLTIEVAVNLDLRRCQPQDFDKYNKSVGQYFLSAVVDKATEELTRLSVTSAFDLSIFDANLEQPQHFDSAGSGVFKITLTFRKASHSTTSSPARVSRGLRDAVAHDKLLRKVSKDLAELELPSKALGASKKSPRNSRSRADAVSRHLQKYKNMFPQIEELAQFNTGHVKEAVDGVHTVGTLRFSAGVNFARVDQVCRAVRCSENA